MNSKEEKAENQEIFHVIYIIMLLVFGILFIAVMFISGWPMPAVLFISFGVISSWIMHFMKIGSPKGRLYWYTFVITSGIIYYGSRKDTLTDVPIIICLFIILLSINLDMKLIYMVSSAYPLLLIWHMFVTGYLGPDTNQVVISSVFLGIICLFCAVGISAFFVKQQSRNNELHVSAEKRLIYERTENERFLSNVSHELRTPINVVNGMSELILLREKDEILLEDVRDIQDAGKRLYNQVSDILDYSELMTGKLKISCGDYEPLSVINDAVSNISWKSMNPKLEVAVDLSAELPKVLWGDGNKIKKIIISLMDNAIKFTDKGGVYLYVSKRDEDYGINLNIDVWDTGCGMSDEQLNHLYSNFYKKDSSVERTTSGLGLGLAIVHGMVSAMNGFIFIDSTYGRGTHVHVSIPQVAKDRQNSVNLKDSSKYKIVYYFNSEKYTYAEIAVWYRQMIQHVRDELKVEIHGVDSLDKLKAYLSDHNVTHVFVSRWEYEMDKDYFEKLGRRQFVAVFGDRELQLAANSNIHVIYKPIYKMTVINLLRTTLPGSIMMVQSERPKFNNITALVVDDDSMNLTVAKGILRTYGISVVTSMSGADSIEKCMLADYQIIFMDHMMPGMNGTEAMHRIRDIRNGHYEKIPIIALTANAVSGAKEMFFGEGFDAFLPKPIEITELTRILRRTLPQKEVYDE